MLSQNEARYSARAPWLDGCDRDEWGRIVPNLANVMVALRTAPEIERAFGYDEMARASIIVEELPDRANSDPLPRHVSDVDVSRLQEFLQRNGMPKVGREATHQAVDLRAKERSFHPVRDYLCGLKWDSTPRLSSWLTTYLGADATPYVAAIGRMFLIAMVARIFRPGCKCDYMLVLEGDQGIQKSTACRILAGEWFSDNLPDLRYGNSVRVSMHLRGKWLIEIGELSSFSKADAEALKTFISRTDEQYTPKFARKEIVERRQSLFIGTTNKDTYLLDATGARRFWPVKVKLIDLAALTRDRGQLFAEAVAAYRNSEPWWPTPEFEQAHIRAEQEARREVDPWQEPIATYVSGRASVLVGHIAREALRIETQRVGTNDARRIAAVLVGLGWSKSSKKDVAGNYPYLAP